MSVAVVNSYNTYYEGTTLAIDPSVNRMQRIWTRGAVFHVDSDSFEVELQIPLVDPPCAFTVGIAAKDASLNSIMTSCGNDSVFRTQWALMFLTAEYKDNELGPQVNTIHITSPNMELPRNTSRVRGLPEFQPGDEVRLFYDAPLRQLSMSLAGMDPVAVTFPMPLPNFRFAPFVNLGANVSIEVQVRAVDSDTLPPPPAMAPAPPPPLQPRPQEYARAPRQRAPPAAPPQMSAAPLRAAEAGVRPKQSGYATQKKPAAVIKEALKEPAPLVRRGAVKKRPAAR